jgi:hypothetical protein
MGWKEEFHFEDFSDAEEKLKMKQEEEKEKIIETQINNI